MSSRTSEQRQGPVTMRDVARLANVSQSTVSRVLSHSAESNLIGEETRRRVLEAVKQLGYYPNLHARSLRGQKTRLIAMMIADIGNSFYHPMVRAVQDIAHGHHYDVLVANSDHARGNELLFCESLIRRPVDGVIMVPYHLTNDDLNRLIERTGVAIAVLGQHIDHPQVDTVYGNDDQAMYDATRWLIEERGHTRLGFIGVTRVFSAGARREDAFRQALREAGLSMAPERYQEGDWSVDSGERAMRTLLRLPSPPTAVIACNDQMAIGAIVTAQAMSVRVPEDVAVVGFDDIPAASWIRPRLTTIAQFSFAMGERLATALFERIDGVVTGPARRYEIPCRLIRRESA